MMKRELIVDDGRVFWRMEDGSAWCVTERDADRINHAERISEIELYERQKLQAMNGFLLNQLSHIKLLCKPDSIQLPDGRVMEYNPPLELLNRTWEALTKAIKEIELQPETLNTNQQD